MSCWLSWSGIKNQNDFFFINQLSSGLVWISYQINHVFFPSTRISLGSVLRSTRHVNMQDLQVWSRFMSQVAGRRWSYQSFRAVSWCYEFSRKIPSCKKIPGTCDSLDTVQFFLLRAVELLQVLLFHQAREFEKRT